MFSKKFILTSIILLLISLNIYFGVSYFLESKSRKELENGLETQQLNTKIVVFSRLFVEKVLKAKNEVPFEERLQLENSVRALNDKSILDQWEKFTQSKTELEAQENVKELLSLLVNKLSY